LIENLHAIDPGDHHGCRPAQGILQAFHCRDRLTGQNIFITHGLHSEQRYLFLKEDWHHLLLEASKVRIEMAKSDRLLRP
jgi:hypothetical protein